MTRGPFLTSLLWKYGSDITNADPGDEHVAVTTPDPVYRQPCPAVRYVMTNRSGAAPVRFEWTEIGGKTAPTPTMPSVAMDQTTAGKFELMERHHWTKAGNGQVELEIIR